MTKKRRCAGKCRRFLPETTRYFGPQRNLNRGLSSKWATICRKCENDIQKQWRKDNPKRAALIQRRAGLKFKYGITPEQFDSMAAVQGYKCASCRKRKQLVVDHCHKTGKIRGLICTNCNLILGHANDSPVILRALIEYLVK